MEAVEVSGAKTAEGPKKTTENDGWPILDWAVVSSVPEKELPREKIVEFYRWLIQELTKCAVLEYIVPETLNFAAEARDVFIVEAGKEEEFMDAYKSIRNNHPSVIVVFQVLPAAKCDEYEWMKKYTWELGLARQGIQKGNVLSHFEGVSEADRPEIFKSMVDWLLRRIAQLAYGPVPQRGVVLKVTGEGIHAESGSDKAKKKERKVQVLPPAAVQIREGDEDIAPVMSRPPLTTFNPYEVERLLYHVMHRGKPITMRSGTDEKAGAHTSAHGHVFSKEIAIPQGMGYGSTSPETLEEFSKETDILIKGIPNTFTQFEVASIFAEFRVKMVRLGLEAESAFLRLGSKFEVMEAVLRRNETWIRERYRIRVCACHPQIHAEIHRPLTVPPPKSRHSPTGGSHHSSPSQNAQKKKNTKSNSDNRRGGAAKGTQSKSTDKASSQEGQSGAESSQKSKEPPKEETTATSKPDKKGDDDDDKREETDESQTSNQAKGDGTNKKKTSALATALSKNTSAPVPQGRSQVQYDEDDLFS